MFDDKNSNYYTESDQETVISVSNWDGRNNSPSRQLNKRTRNVTMTQTNDVNGVTQYKWYFYNHDYVIYDFFNLHAYSCGIIYTW